MWHVSSRSGVATLRTVINLLLLLIISLRGKTFKRRSFVDAADDVGGHFGAETGRLEDGADDAEDQLGVAQEVVFLELASSLMQWVGTRRDVARAAVVAEFRRESAVRLHGRQQALDLLPLPRNLVQTLLFQRRQTREQLLHDIKSSSSSSFICPIIYNTLV